MILIFIGVMLLLAALLRYFRRAAIALALAVLSGLLLLGAAGGVIPALLLSSLQQPYLFDPAYQWLPQNVIILLTGGTEKLPDAMPPETAFFAYGRTQKTLAVYLDCKKSSQHCTVLISGGDPQHHGVSEAQTCRLTLLQSGVAAEDILLEDQSLNTWQNAQFTAALLKQKKLQGRLVLVTSGLHMRRSLMFFSHFGVDPSPARADYLGAKFLWGASAYNLMLTDAAMHEVLGTWRYQLTNLMGGNA